MQDDVEKPAKTVRMALPAPIAGSGQDAVTGVAEALRAAAAGRRVIAWSQAN